MNNCGILNTTVEAENERTDILFAERNVLVREDLFDGIHKFELVLEGNSIEILAKEERYSY